jgi:hypothetical protein
VRRLIGSENTAGSIGGVPFRILHAMRQENNNDGMPNDVFLREDYSVGIRTPPTRGGKFWQRVFHQLIAKSNKSN